MKKYYIVALIASFFVAAICIGAVATFASTWNAKDKTELNNLIFAKSSWTYAVVEHKGEDVGKIVDANPMTISLQGYDEVEVIVPNGNIQIAAVAGTEAKLTAQNLAEDCQVYLVRYSDELRVKFAKKDKKSEGCTGDLTAEIPASMELDITGGQGDVTIEKWAGDIKAKVGAGDVLVTGKSSKIKVDVGAGKLEAKLLEKITEGEWDFQIGMGSINVEVPNGQIVKEKYTTGIGSKTILNKGKEPSSFEVSATSGVGDIVTIAK